VRAATYLILLTISFNSIANTEVTNKVNDIKSSNPNIQDEAEKTNTNILILSLMDQLIKLNEQNFALVNRVEALEIKTSELSPTKFVDKDNGQCLIKKKYQICWGSLTIIDNSHVRSFSFNFPAPFAVTPTITNGINTVSNGYLFSVFSHSITTDSYKGTLAENHSFRKNSAPVTMNYIAIGIPK
jgi:hypothetical protein